MRTLLKNCLILGKELKDILIEDGYIINTGKANYRVDDTIDVKGYIVIPGAIDPHVHMRDPGFTYKEDWLSGSIGALTSGVTTVFDMPNTIPPTIDTSGLLEKRKAGEKSIVNYGFHFGATKDNFIEIEKAKNIAGIKVFLSSNANFIIEDKDTLRKVFETAKKIDKPVVVHSELEGCIRKNLEMFKHPAIFDHNKIRSKECAIEATKLILELAKETGVTLYIAHITTKEELELVEKARGENVKVFVEATPHHIFLDETYLKDFGNFLKVNPPLRSVEDRLALFEAVVQGKIDTIGSDHAPHTRDEKTRPYPMAPAGIPGVETTMPLLINEALKGRLSFERLVELTSKNASRIFRMRARGEIKEGFFADLVVINPEENFTIKNDRLFTKAKFSPFEGRVLKGKIYLTMVNGIIKFFDGRIINTSKGMEVHFYD